MRNYVLTLCIALQIPTLAWAASSPKLVLPEFSGLTQKASDSVSITLDADLLAMASHFLDANNPQDAATQEVIKGLRGIYVRSFTFEKEFSYSQADVESVRAQLSTPGWNRLLQTRTRKTHADVDIYIMLDNNQAVGLALIASEPRQFTIVNIVGAVDLDKLHKLEGQFGVPKLDLGGPQAKAPQDKVGPQK